MKKKIFPLRNEGSLVFQYVRIKTDTQYMEYDAFYKDLSDFYIIQLRDIISKHLNVQYPDVEVVIHDLFAIENQKKELVKGRKSITLDSYSQQKDSVKLGVSRIFQDRGETQIGVEGRPGYSSLENQVKVLQKALPSGTYVLIDDDIFTGSTVKAVTDILLQYGFDIAEVIVGFRVGEQKNVTIPIRGIQDFHADEVLNFTDPRDFLFGAYEGGLAVKLTNGKKARVPYIWPFCNPSVRVGIPEVNAHDFSIDIIDLNKIVYEKIDTMLSRQLKISELWPSFYTYLNYMYRENEKILGTSLGHKNISIIGIITEEF